MLRNIKISVANYHSYLKIFTCLKYNDFFFFNKWKVQMCSSAKMPTFNWIITAGNTDPKLEASMKCNLCLTPIKDLEIGFSASAASATIHVIYYSKSH